MDFNDLEEQLYNLYCNSEFEKIITIARKEFLEKANALGYEETF